MNPKHLIKLFFRGYTCIKTVHEQGSLVFATRRFYLSYIIYFHEMSNHSLSDYLIQQEICTLQYDNVLGHTFQTVLINHIHLVLLLRKDRYHIIRNDWIDIWNTEYIIEATTIFHTQVEFCKQIVIATEYPTNLVATSPHKAADNVRHSDVCSCTFLRRTTVTHKGIQHSGENSNSTQAV